MMILESDDVPQITLKLFGRVSFWQEGNLLAELAPQQAVWLLAYIALYESSVENREEIGTLFWPEKDAHKVSQNLRHCLHILKKLLEPLPLPFDTLHIEGRCICLYHISTDVAEFKALIAETQSTSDIEARITSLQYALSLYTAPLLPNCYMDWAVAEREHLAELYQMALSDLSRAQEGLQRWEQALETARLALQENPLSEEISLNILRLYAKMGRPTDLQRQAQEMERLLQEEFGATPSDSVQVLISQWLEEARKNATERAGNYDPPVTPPVAAPKVDTPPVNSAIQTLSKPRSRLIRRAVASALLILLVLLGGWFKLHAPRVVIARPGERLSGEESWVNHITALQGDKDSEPTAMTTDQKGNVYVTGFVDTAKTDIDFVTMKYDRNGDIFWEKRFDGTAHDVDRARSISVDMKGNVYVTGETLGTSGNGIGHLSELDMVTVKYAPDGTQIWAKPYDSPGHGRDSGWQNLLDKDGNLYVFGQCQSGTGKGFLYTLLKYDPDGNLMGNPHQFPALKENEPPSNRMVLASDGTLYLAMMTPLLGTSSTMNLTCFREAHIVWQKTFPNKSNGEVGFLQLYLSRTGEPLLAVVNSPLQIVHEYSLFRLNPQNGEILKQWTSPQTNARQLKGGFAGSLDGHIYFGACFENKLYIWSLTSTLSTLWSSEYHGTGGTAQFGGIARAPENGGYVSGSASYIDAPKSGSADEKGEEIFTRLFDANKYPKRLIRYSGAEIRMNRTIALFVDSEGVPVVCGQAFDGKYHSIVTLQYRP